jgi:hypothetical protein
VTSIAARGGCNIEALSRRIYEHCARFSWKCDFRDDERKQAGEFVFFRLHIG